MVFEPGRLCVKNAGRENGKYCVIVASAEKDHVIITGPKPLTGVRRRKCSVLHLEPTPQLLKIKKDATDKDVLDAFSKEKLFEKLGLKELSDADLKKWEDEQKTREAKKKEQKPKEEPKKESPKEEKKSEPKKSEVKEESKKEPDKKEPSEKKEEAKKESKLKTEKKSAAKKE